MEQNISNQFIQRSLLEFNSHRSDTYIALITARVSQLDNDDYIILEKLYNNTWKEIRELASKLDIPVSTTLMGIGTYPQDDALSLGMLGMHGNYWANLAVSNCDVLFAIGTRFNDRITGCLKKFCADAKVIHIDIDPCSISKNVKASIPIVGDIKNVLSLMISQLEKSNHVINEELKNKCRGRSPNRPVKITRRIYEKSK